MHPVLYRTPFPILGHLTIYSFGVCVVIGVFAAIAIATWLGRRRGIDPDRISGLGVATVLAGLVGARLFYFVQFHGQFAGKPFWTQVGLFFSIWEGGIVYYGGLLAGIPAGLLYIHRHRIPLRAMLDVVAPALAIGLALGRLGCFLNGCCYGDICADEAPYAVQFPRHWGPPAEEPSFDDKPWTAPFQHQVDAGKLPSTAQYTLPVYPTQLLSSFDAFVLFLLLLWVERRRHPEGSLFFLFLALYPFARYLEESLRADNARVLWGFTISQWIGFPLVLVGLAGLLLLKKRVGAQATVPGAPAVESKPD